MSLTGRSPRLLYAKPVWIFALLAAQAILPSLLGCSDHRTGQHHRQAPQQEFVSIGSVKWDELDAQRAAHEALRSMGIVMSVEGSKVYDISVPKGKERLAFEVLKTNTFYLNGVLRLTEPTNHLR